MTNALVPGVVVFVVDVARVALFYESVASMRRVGQDGDHVVLELAGFQLVIHRMRGGPEPDGAAAGPVQPREDSCMKVCLPVASIGAAREAALRCGGLIRPASFEWDGAGYRACDGHDPEGNIVQVREIAGG